MLSFGHSMRIQIICPAPPMSLYGNRVTADRWASIFQKLGHKVTVATHYGGRICELVIAMHARRSAEAAEKFQAKYSDRPLVVALTGTDLYSDLPESPEALRSLELADRLVALHPLARKFRPERELAAWKKLLAELARIKP